MEKILILTNHSYMLYQFRRELIQRLQENYEVVLSMPFVGHEDDFMRMGCRCIETKIDRRGVNPRTDFRLFRFYWRILSQEKPNKVLTYSIKPNVYGGFLCMLKGISYYANVQGLGTAFQKKGMAQFVSFLYRNALRKVKAVFFENQENAEEFVKRKLVDQKKIVVLHGAGVNLEQYRRGIYKNSETDKLRKRGQDDKKHFLYLGRIMKEKGIDELFSAVRKLNREYGDKVVLDMVGFFEDEYKEQVENLEKQGIVKFYGFQKETRPYYEMADCVVLPSYHEGMSNVLLEASSMEIPVITSDIPGCREAVEDERTGYLCKVGDSEMLYQRMKRIVEMDNRELVEMGKRARKRMRQLFDKTKIVEQTAEIISRK